MINHFYDLYDLINSYFTTSYDAFTVYGLYAFAFLISGIAN
jgi:hypothetical protein